jgi:hypothetical protein
MMKSLESATGQSSNSAVVLEVPLARAGRPSWGHLSSITEMVAAHSHDRDPSRRAERIRDAARGWLRFWRGRLDLDSLAWEVAEMLSDIEIADAAHRESRPGDT